MEMSLHAKSSRLARAAAGILPLFLAVQVLPAKDGRDFAGTYQIKGAVQHGPNVQVTLAFNITNYSGADIAGGTVSLVDRLPGRPAYGSLASEAISHRQSIQLQSNFTVPTGEYQSWFKGGTPLLIFERKDSAGNPVRRPVELVRIP
jgi:hypothetical protein